MAVVDWFFGFLKRWAVRLDRGLTTTKWWPARCAADTTPVRALRLFSNWPVCSSRHPVGLGARFAPGGATTELLLVPAPQTLQGETVVLWLLRQNGFYGSRQTVA
jgi:hypothetical protein